MLSKKQGFTLVELIVVITILAILGTIAFMAFGGFSKNARDSVRVHDLLTIVKGLESFELNAGFFPEPSNSFDITYSGAIAWTQGTFGQSTFRNLGTINTLPVDPLTRDKYAYSITNAKNEFQIAAIFEGGNELAKDNLILPQSYAAETKGRLRVTLQGNYNGQFVKTNSGSTMYILGVPSIITSEIESVDILTILANKTLVYKGYSNLPASYAESGYTMTGGFDFGDTVEPLIFEGTQAELSDPIDPTARLTLITNLQNLYAGTILETDGNLEELLTTDIDIATPSDEAKLLAASVVDNTMGTEIVRETGLSGGSSSSSSGGGAECILTQEEVDELNALGISGDIYVYIDEERNEATYPLTGEEWCTIYSLDWYAGSPISPAIWSLTNLPSLYLRGNSLTSIPSEIANLSNLQNLDLSSNSFSSFPAEIGDLTNLHSLSLSNNSFSSLPAPIGNLTNLEELYISYNSLTSLPSEIGSLTNLQYLDLENNSLTSLPVEVGNLVNLQELYLSNNSLTSLPAEIGNCTGLGHLNVSYNYSLASVPESMEDLINLEYLDLGNTNLINYPTSINDLTNLTHLDLRNTYLINLPASIGNLTKLEYLNLGANSLTGLPTEIGDLTNMAVLGLSSNSLVNIPASIGNLTNLTSLNLSNNSLTSLPDEIGSLNNLVLLFIQINSLATLPFDMCNLANLEQLNLDENPLLGNFASSFTYNSEDVSKNDFPYLGASMTIGGNGTKIVILCSIS